LRSTAALYLGYSRRRITGFSSTPNTNSPTAGHSDAEKGGGVQEPLLHTAGSESAVPKSLHAGYGNKEKRPNGSVQETEADDDASEKTKLHSGDEAGPQTAPGESHEETSSNEDEKCCSSDCDFGVYNKYNFHIS
jgi:hypothetical protein